MKNIFFIILAIVVFMALVALYKKQQADKLAREEAARIAAEELEKARAAEAKPKPKPAPKPASKPAPKPVVKPPPKKVINVPASDIISDNASKLTGKGIYASRETKIYNAQGAETGTAKAGDYLGVASYVSDGAKIYFLGKGSVKYMVYAQSVIVKIPA